MGPIWAVALKKSHAKSAFDISGTMNSLVTTLLHLARTKTLKKLLLTKIVYQYGAYMGPIWASPYGLAQIQPIWDPYRLSSDVCLQVISIQIHQDHIIKAYNLFKETKHMKNSHFVNVITIRGPHRSHLGKPIWASP